MEDKYRKSGIDTIGDIPWGTHICQFYYTKDNLTETLVPYFKAGLENNEFCMWVTSEPLGVKDAKESLGKAVRDLGDYISKGQIEILDYSEWYTKSGKFNAEKVLHSWVEKEMKALEKGFSGLRFTRNTFWLGAKDWVDFREYEAIMDSIVIGEHRMIAICTYPLDKCKASEVLDVMNNHEATLIKQKGLWRTVESNERKRLKKVLSASETRYRRLFETAQDGIIILDADTENIIDINPFLVDMLGYSHEDFLGKKLWEIGTFRDIEASKTAFQELQRKGYVRYEDLPLQTRDGKQISVEFVSNIYEVDHKRVIQCNIRNITDRKQAEDTLAQSERKYRELAESISDVFFAMDKELRCIYWNKASEKVTGVSAKDALGKHLYDLFPDVEATRIAEELYLKAIRTKQPQQFVNEYQLGGKDFTFEINAYPSQDSVSVFVKDITERVKADKALRESEQKYRQLLEDINDGYAVIQEGEYVFANRRFGEIFGYQPGQTVGKSIGQLIVSDDRRATVERYEKVMRGEEAPVERYEGKAIREDGTTIIIEASIKVIQYEDKPAFSAIVRDITEHKRAERELELKAQLLDAATDSIALHDLEGRLIYVNEAACKSHGYTKDELMAMDTRDLTAPEYAKSIESWMREVKKREVIAQTVHLRKDKSTMPLEVSSKVIEWGGVKFYLSVARDITERKKAEEATLEAEGKYRTMMDNASDMILLADSESNILEANRKAAGLLGYTKEELLHIAVAQIHPKEELERSLAAFREIAQKGSASLNNMRILRKDGGIVPVDITGNIIEYAGKKMSQWIFRDISERRRMEEQLIITDRLASIGELVSGVAHELNNPLTSIIGLSELLLGKDVPDDVKEDLRTINNEAQRTAGVVRNLLTFARKHPEEKQLVHINNMVQKVLELRAYEQKANNIQVNTQLASGLPQIMADGFQLQQVFMNIIINAEYFMIEAHGRGILTITTERVGDIIQASLADDGPGIAEENLGHIFDPFFTTKEVGKGTGLGLSICHGIVSAHSGRIYAENKSGKGATFVVELPITQ